MYSLYRVLHILTSQVGAKGTINKLETKKCLLEDQLQHEFFFE